MRPAKRNISFWCSILLFCTVFYLSCGKPDGCENMVCNNEGVCVDGNCSCPAGYEGATCELKWSDKFAGTWLADEVYYKDSVHRYFAVQSVSLNPDSILMHNLADSYSVIAVRAAYRRFNFIANQRPDSFFTLTEGYGQMDESGTVTGLYSFSLKMLINDSTTKDTLITTKFAWKKQ